MIRHLSFASLLVAPALLAQAKPAPAPKVVAVRAATINAAELLGWSGKVGELSPGSYADLIALAGDPLADVTQLEHPTFVMKGGRVELGGAAQRQGGGELPR
jgi:cytosine/adenosine deaminase-related metal-dependent hydrolase